MILIVNNDLVDLDRPIRMTDRQIRDFKIFIKEEFGSCEVKYTKEKTPNRSGIETDRRDWTVKELVQLFSGKDTSVLVKELNRNAMSIQMMSQKIIFEVINWAKKRGRAIPPTEQDIKEFLGEKD